MENKIQTVFSDVINIESNNDINHITNKKVNFSINNEYESDSDNSDHSNHSNDDLDNENIVNDTQQNENDISDESDNDSVISEKDYVSKMDFDIDVSLHMFLERYEHFNRPEAREIIKYMFEILVKSNPDKSHEYYVNFVISNLMDSMKNKTSDDQFNDIIKENEDEN